jgi:DNA-directed RNA polymerase beta subunit
VWLNMLIQMRSLSATSGLKMKLVSFDDELKFISVPKFAKTNQGTCMNLKPIVKKGDK